MISPNLANASSRLTPFLQNFKISSLVFSCSFTSPKSEANLQSEPELKVAQILPKSREISDEEIFLANLAERIEVLFEGLKQTSEQDLSQRLELTTKFLEFTLANIENRLQNLSK